jgi:hypothetical protein
MSPQSKAEPSDDLQKSTVVMNASAQFPAPADASSNKKQSVALDGVGLVFDAAVAS